MTAGGALVRARIAELAFDHAGQPKQQVRRCNLCGDADRQVTTAVRRDRYGYPAGFVICGCCGLGYLSPRLTAGGYADFYATVYRPLVSAYHGRRIDAETVQVEQRAYAAGLLDFLPPELLGRPRTILDVGGSTGIVARALAERFGAAAWVLDPAPDELAVARAAGMGTIAGLAEEFDPGDQRWDLVLLCQTIDHLLDLRATLSALRAATALAGRAFVDILDVEVMLARRGDIEDVVKIDHPYYLTRASAQALFGVTGYTVLAERLTDDGHRGFLLAPGAGRQPDWGGRRASAEAFARRVQAGSPKRPPDLEGDPPDS